MGSQGRSAAIGGWTLSRRAWLAALAGVVIGLSLLAGCAPDPRLALCTGDGQGTAQQSFEIPDARRYREFIPLMGDSPELEAVPGPALIVIYADGYQGALFGGPGGVRRRAPEPGTVDICVVVSSGERHIYGNVDITGLVVPQP